MALPTASDNPFPSILITEGTEPAAPAAGKQRLYIDSTTHKLKRTDSSGVDVTIESASSGGMATDPLWAAAGDVAVATGNDTAGVVNLATAGKVLVGNGSTAVAAYPPGYEFDYAQVTSGGNITATVEASANTIVSGAAVSYDGSTAIIIEFYCLGLLSPAAQTTYLLLFDGSTSLGYIGQGLTNLNPTMYVRRRLTPSNASHTYSIRAIVTGGTGSFTAGAGGAGANMPAFIRQTKA